jgi:hypothetical protein
VRAIKEKSIMENNQMELNIDGLLKFPGAMIERRRLSRTRWWFRQMHRTVNAARDWDSPPRPSQVWLVLPQP